MSSILSANDWLKKNKNKYINGSSVVIVMQQYAIYYNNMLNEVNKKNN
jgi:hypothetical protein